MVLAMFDRNRLSLPERKRLLDYLVFKLRHGGNVVSAMKTYMEGNRSKSSVPVQQMLDEIADGGDLADVALARGMVDKYGHLILRSGVEPAKALPVVRDMSITANRGVTAIVLKEVIGKWIFSLLTGLALVADAGRQPLVSIYDKMNQTAVAAGSAPEPLPAYLAQPWFVTQWVVVAGVLLLLAGIGLWWINRFRTPLMYRMARFRFYEDWSRLLALYLAFRASGQSDQTAALSLAAASAEGSFNHQLFTEVADAMKSQGRSFYDVLVEHEGAIPSEVLSFFLDASKTGQTTAYFTQAKEFCEARLDSILETTKQWVPALTGITVLLVFGLMIADLFVKLTVVTMKPLTG